MNICAFITQLKKYNITSTSEFPLHISLFKCFSLTLYGNHYPRYFYRVLAPKSIPKPFI